MNERSKATIELISKMSHIHKTFWEWDCIRHNADGSETEGTVQSDGHLIAEETFEPAEAEPKADLADMMLELHQGRETLKFINDHKADLVAQLEKAIANSEAQHKRNLELETILLKTKPNQSTI